MFGHFGVFESTEATSLSFFCSFCWRAWIKTHWSIQTGSNQDTDTETSSCLPPFKISSWRLDTIGFQSGWRNEGSTVLDPETRNNPWLGQLRSLNQSSFWSIFKIKHRRDSPGDVGCVFQLFLGGKRSMFLTKGSNPQPATPKRSSNLTHGYHHHLVGTLGTNQGAWILGSQESGQGP